MRLSDLQPLDRLIVCKHSLEHPEWMINVDHRDAGDLDLMCNHRHTVDDLTWMHAAHMGVAFPQTRSLSEVPVGQTAVYRDGAWSLEDLPYEDGDSPGDLPPPPERTLDGWTFTCDCCGEQRTGLPELAFPGPVQVADAEGDPDYQILEHTDDLCRIRIEGQEYFFIRGLLPIRIPEAQDTYNFGVWTTIGPQNFARYRETFHGEQRDLGGMFGYLSNALPGVPNSLSLQLTIVPNAPGARPWLILRPPEEPHPLFEAQKDGVAIETLLEWIGPSINCSDKPT